MKEKIMRKHMQERIGGGEITNYTLEPPLPSSLNIELNNTCNQKCIFCPFHGKYAPQRLKPAVLDAEFVKELLDQAKELGIGKKEVGFYLAGEAFVYPKFEEIVAYAKKLGFQYIFLTTNGALAKPDRMKAVIDAGIDSIRFSVNAADRETYKEMHGTDDFDTVLDNIKYMYQYITENEINVATSLSCVITKKTQGIQEQVKNVFSEYVDDILFIPVILSRFGDIQELKEIYEIQDDEGAEINPDYVCPIIFNSMYINALGQVVPCCETYDSKLAIADLKKDPDLEKAWRCSGYEKYRKIFLKKESDTGTICETCVMRKFGVQRLFMD